MAGILVHIYSFNVSHMILRNGHSATLEQTVSINSILAKFAALEHQQKKSVIKTWTTLWYTGVSTLAWHELENHFWSWESIHPDNIQFYIFIPRPAMAIILIWYTKNFSCIATRNPFDSWLLLHGSGGNHYMLGAALKKHHPSWNRRVDSWVPSHHTLVNLLHIIYMWFAQL